MASCDLIQLQRVLGTSAISKSGTTSHAREDLPFARITAALSAKVNLLTQKRSLTTIVLCSQSDFEARRELGSVCSR